MSHKPTVLILAGGPDPEHEVSLDSARAIERALREGTQYEPTLRAFDTINGPALASLGGDLVWPALHGRFGEGGEMQRLLEADGRPFVGSGSDASSVAIDKAESKRVAAQLIDEMGLVRVRVNETTIFSASDREPPMPFPFVVKPTHEGSTIGLFVCANDADWREAHELTQSSARGAMVESFVKGRELTIGMIDRGEGLACLPTIEIAPADGLYDYRAKYERDDTRYTLSPTIPDATTADMRMLCAALTARIGVRDLCRVDFIMDGAGDAWFLELNTMPGFTSHSLVPMACGDLGMTGLCELIASRAHARAAATTHGR